MDVLFCSVRFTTPLTEGSPPETGGARDPEPKGTGAGQEAGKRADVPREEGANQR